MARGGIGRQGGRSTYLGCAGMRRDAESTLRSRAQPTTRPHTPSGCAPPSAGPARPPARLVRRPGSAAVTLAAVAVAVAVAAITAPLLLTRRLGAKSLLVGGALYVAYVAAVGLGIVRG
jgi:hypothetical protein